MTECMRLIKLFGKTIMVPMEGGMPEATIEEGGDGGAAVLVVGMAEEGGKESTTGVEKDVLSPANWETAQTKNPKPDDEQSGLASPPEKKTVRRPNKVLPCPRCNSMDTKFCYYNNYNPGQPRHFCRGCQRYWTAGGAIRNLPVGAGRRKSKRSAGLYHRLIAVSETSLQGLHQHPVLKRNKILSSFGSNTPPLCDSMALALNLPEHRLPCPGAPENGEERSSGSSVTASNSPEEGVGTNLQKPTTLSSQVNLPQVTGFNGSLWAPLWSFPAPAFPCSTFPITCHPKTTHWGCAQPAPPSSYSLNGVGSSGCASNSPTLKEYQREENVLTEISGERCLSIPTTLRIVDPEEVAKSSVWAAMAIKDGKAGGSSSGGLFMGFDQANLETRNQAMGVPTAVQANPAALFRSLNFHERL